MKKKYELLKKIANPNKFNRRNKKPAANRKEALSTGNPLYYSFERPCPKGHLMRRTNDYMCVTCRTHKRKKVLDPNNKMIEIDHLKEYKDFFLDNYYYLD